MSSKEHTTHISTPIPTGGYGGALGPKGLAPDGTEILRGPITVQDGSGLWSGIVCPLVMGSEAGDG